MKTYVHSPKYLFLMKHTSLKIFVIYLKTYKQRKEYKSKLNNLVFSFKNNYHVFPPKEKSF